MVESNVLDIVKIFSKVSDDLLDINNLILAVEGPSCEQKMTCFFLILSESLYLYCSFDC